MYCKRADSPGWKAYVDKYPNFFAEPRNLVLGVCGDGVVPFEKACRISFHFIVLCVYNYPPEIRMKRENLILYGVAERKPVSSHIVYKVFVEELLQLWAGVPCWDVQQDKQFWVRALLMMGIFDWPGNMDATVRMHEGVVPPPPPCMHATAPPYMSPTTHVCHCPPLHVPAPPCMCVSACNRMEIHVSAYIRMHVSVCFFVCPCVSHCFGTNAPLLVSLPTARCYCGLWVL
jgi:hypothetical protein